MMTLIAKGRECGKTATGSPFDCCLNRYCRMY